MKHSRGCRAKFAQPPYNFSQFVNTISSKDIEHCSKSLDEIELRPNYKALATAAPRKQSVKICFSQFIDKRENSRDTHTHAERDRQTDSRSIETDREVHTCTHARAHTTHTHEREREREANLYSTQVNTHSCYCLSGYTADLLDFRFLETN